jgi:iron complex outermembrane recepter protein
MKHIISTILLLTVFVTASWAQQKIKGKVTDARTGLPLTGATITGSTKNVTITDKDGIFYIDCNLSSQVTISFVGYEKSVQTIKNCDDELSIALKPSNMALNEVEITATSNTNQSILYQPLSITKLSTTELKRSTGLFFDDIINLNVPGVTFERRAVNSGQQFNIRGYGSGARGRNGVSSNFDGQGYKVYLNGIPVTDAEGITVMDDLDFGSIGNVEVVKGPAGTLYGQAIAGAVNLKTIRPERGKTSLEQQVMLGNYGLQRYTTQFQSGGEKSSILLNYGKQRHDGYFYHNASHKDFVNVALDFQPTEKQSISVYAGFADSYDERGGEQTIAQYKAKSDTGNFEYIKRNGHSHLVSFRAGVTHNYAFNNWLSNFTTVYGTGWYNDVSSAGGWTDKTTLNYGTRSAFNTKFALSNKVTLSGITGLEIQRQNAQTIGYNMKASPFDATPTVWTPGEPYWVLNAITGNTYTKSTTQAYFTEWTLSLPQDFSVTGGIGVSSVKFTLEDRFNPATAIKSSIFDTSYKKMWAPHFAINKVFNNKISVYASYSTGFKAPVSGTYFIAVPAVGATPANARIVSGLKPEKGTQYEIGSKGSLMEDRLSYELSFFNAIFQDKMTGIAVKNPNDATGVTLYTITANGGKQNHKGVEALLKYTVYQSNSGFFRPIHPFTNFTYSDFKYEDFRFHYINTGNKDSTVNYSGHHVAGVPKVTFNAGLDFGLQYGIYGNVTYAYRDKMPIVSTEEFFANSYSLLNSRLGIRQSLGRHFDMDLFFGVNNITNTQYPIKVFINQLTNPLSTTSGDAYIPGPRKANYYGGLNLKYNF